MAHAARTSEAARRAPRVRARTPSSSPTPGRLALEAYRGNANGNAAADVEHPAITARLLHDAGCDETTVATAVLHDVIEDTGLDAARDRASAVGPEIARRVEALTEDAADRRLRRAQGASCARAGSPPGRRSPP